MLPLLLAVLLLCVGPSAASLAAGSKCPLDIDCAKERRHLCQRGSSRCGPCLSVFVENEEGRCVRKTQRHGKVTSFPNLDDEIDFYRSVLEKQQMTEINSQQRHSKHHAAVDSQTDVKKSEADAPRYKGRSQIQLAAEAVHVAATAQRPMVSALLPNTSTPQPRATKAGDRAGPIAVPTPKNDNAVVIIISVCVVIGSIAVILATVFYIKFQRESRLAQKVDYPAFSGAGMPPATANGTSMGDKTLAQSAQMYHYQHQKQQMRSLGNSKTEQKAHETEVTSDEEEVGGDFTVYECPGLAPTGEMEVKNPLFDDSTLHYQGNHNYFQRM